MLQTERVLTALCKANVAFVVISKQAAGRPKDLRLLPELQALQALRTEPREEEQ